MRRTGPLARLAAVLCGVAALLMTGCGAQSGPSAPVRDATLRIDPTIDGVAAGMRIGVIANTLDAGSGRGAQQREVRAVGAGWLREELRWGEVEPRRGVHRWERFDRLLASAAREHLRVLPLLTGAPDWSDRGLDGLPGDVDAFAAHVAAAVARYGPGGQFWRDRPQLDGRLAPRFFELFNEPFLRRDGAVVDPARYAALARAGALAGKASNPRARFLLAADTSYQGDEAQPAWLDALLAAAPDLLDVVDAVAVHPYGTIGAEGANPDPRQRVERIEQLRLELAAHGRPEMPLWVTELGWSTCTGGDRQCVDELDQARNVAAALRFLTRPELGIRAIFLYHLNDWDVLPEGGREGAFGFHRQDGSEKPAWQLLRRAVSRG